MGGHVGAVLLGWPQRLFSCGSPSRRSVDQIVVSDTAPIPRSTGLACNSAKVMPGLAAVRSRSTSSCPAGSGLRWPPIRAGAVLPVSRTRRASLIAADPLTSKRRAAARAELWDRGSEPLDGADPADGAEVPDEVPALTGAGAR